jgi:DJ-1 family protein
MKALVLLAPGFEEIEAITAIDVLRRAGFQVTAAGTVEGPITASRQTRHLADTDLDRVANEPFDVIVLPGGNEGTAHLARDERVIALLRRQKQAGRWIAAICAAPAILAGAGLLDPGQRLTCHPAIRDRIPAQHLDPEKRVVVHGRLITSLAAGSSGEFAYAIVQELQGRDAVERVNAGMHAPTA